MLGRTPESVAVVSPVEYGRIRNFRLTEIMLTAYVKEVCGNKIFMPRVVVCVPSGVSEVVVNALKVDFWDIHEMANKICAVLAFVLVACAGHGIHRIFVDRAFLHQAVQLPVDRRKPDRKPLLTQLIQHLAGRHMRAFPVPQDCEDLVSMLALVWCANVHGHVSSVQN